MATTSAATLVVGGGIGGLTAALALAKAGCEVLLLERAAEFTEIGAGLQVGPNATRMMDRLGLLDELLEYAVLPRYGVMRHALTGEPLTRLDLGSSFRERYGYPYVVVHRSDMLSVLVAACRAEPLIQLENNKTVTEVWSDDTVAGVRCADGTAYSAELLVGADGLSSVVRTLISQDKPVPSGFVAYRGTLPMHEVQTEVDNQDVVLWVGPGLHRAVRGSAQRDLQPGRRVPQRRFRGDDVVGDVLEELAERFSETCAEVQNTSRASTAAAAGRCTTAIRSTPGPTGRTVLLGDAAHPMLQYLAQGACQAMEDTLARARRLLRRVGGDIDTALTSYEAVRLERRGLCQPGHGYGAAWRTGDPVTLALRDRFMRMDEQRTSELDWLYAAEAAS